MRKLLALLSLVLLPLTTVVGAAEPAEEFAQSMAGMKTLAGKFSQRIFDADGNELQESSGHFKVKRPGYFWWQVAPPFEQLVIGTPESLKIYDPDLEQMAVHARDSLVGSPVVLISGDTDKISADYEVSVNQDKGRQLFTFIQKDTEQGSFGRLIFTFMVTNGEKMLENLAFVDKLGQRTEISLSGLKLNKDIADEVFQFEPPTGTDIIADD